MNRGWAPAASRQGMELVGKIRGKWGMLRRFFGIVYLHRRQSRKRPPVSGGSIGCSFDREARKGDHEQS